MLIELLTYSLEPHGLFDDVVVVRDLLDGYRLEKDAIAVLTGRGGAMSGT